MKLHPNEAALPAHLESEQVHDDDAPEVLGEDGVAMSLRTAPEITLTGPPLMNVPVLTTDKDKLLKHYHDFGASCFDKIDGISGHGQYPLLTVDGEVVNLARIGSYKVNYHCVNSAGIWSKPMFRTVVVTGALMHSCQNIEVSGVKVAYFVRAGKSWANPQAQR